MEMPNLNLIGKDVFQISNRIYCNTDEARNYVNGMLTVSGYKVRQALSVENSVISENARRRLQPSYWATPHSELVARCTYCGYFMPEKDAVGDYMRCKKCKQVIARMLPEGSLVWFSFRSATSHEIPLSQKKALPAIVHHWDAANGRLHLEPVFTMGVTQYAYGDQMNQNRTKFEQSGHIIAVWYKHSYIGERPPPDNTVELHYAQLRLDVTLMQKWQGNYYGTIEDANMQTMIEVIETWHYKRPLSPTLYEEVIRAANLEPCFTEPAQQLPLWTDAQLHSMVMFALHCTQLDAEAFECLLSRNDFPRDPQYATLEVKLFCEQQLFGD